METSDLTRETERALITGVAPGSVYDSTVELLFDDTDAPTVKLAALSPAATVKMPVVVFDAEVSA